MGDALTSLSTGSEAVNLMKSGLKLSFPKKTV